MLGTRRISVFVPPPSGTRLAHSTASSFEATSRIQKPLKSSLVSPYGPSVATGGCDEKSTTMLSFGSSSPSAATSTPALISSSL